jgi:hypothetical protein
VKAAGKLSQVFQDVGEALAHAGQLLVGVVQVGGSIVCATRTASARDTSRSGTPSWRLRSKRRRVSSLAATMRARDAARSARAWTLAIAVATSSVNFPTRSSVSGGNGSGSKELTAIAPQGCALTMTGQEIV